LSYAGVSFGSYSRGHPITPQNLCFAGAENPRLVSATGR